MSPAHPAALLADKRVPLFDPDGTHRGSINNKNYKASFHRWGADTTGTGSTDTPITYNVSKSNRNGMLIALIDRGANGIVAGNDCTWIGGPVLPRSVSITGIDNHQMTNIPVGIVGAVSQSQRGPVICVFHEAA